MWIASKSTDEITTDIPHQVEEQRQCLRHGDDRHADPEPQLSADVRDQLEDFIIRHLFGNHQVAVGKVDGDTGEVLPGDGPVGTTEVVSVQLEVEWCLRCNSKQRLVIMQSLTNTKT